MEIITLQSEVWKALNERLELIAEHLNQQKPNQYDNLWLNNHDVCEYLHISSRTLARMRKNGDISYAKNRGQYFYTLGEIKRLLQSRRIRSNQEYLEDLIQKGKQYVEKARNSQ